MSDYSKIIEKLKEIDWAPVAEKVMDVISNKTSPDLDELSEEDRLDYAGCVQDVAKLTMALMLTDEADKPTILMELGMVRLSMESMEARNALFSYRKTVEVVGAVLAATIIVALALA